MEGITVDKEVMGGKPCIRGLRVTVKTITDLVYCGRTKEEILKAYPYITDQDIDNCIKFDNN